MRNTDKIRQSGCPVAYGLDVFGDRWSFLIIREMLIKGKNKYGDFLEADEGISTNILADRLKHLEAEGIITKSRDPVHYRSFNYALTEKGFDLTPIILDIIAWGGKYDRRPFALRAIVKKIDKDRKGFEAQIRRGETDY